MRSLPTGVCLEGVDLPRGRIYLGDGVCRVYLEGICLGLVCRGDLPIERFA